MASPGWSQDLDDLLGELDKRASGSNQPNSQPIQSTPTAIPTPAPAPIPTPTPKYTPPPISTQQTQPPSMSQVSANKVSSPPSQFPSRKATCAFCLKDINDEALEAGGFAYHIKCLICARCGVDLNGKKFIPGDKPRLYCFDCGLKYLHDAILFAEERFDDFIKFLWNCINHKSVIHSLHWPSIVCVDSFWSGPGDELQV